MGRIYATRIGGAEAAGCVVAGRGMEEIRLEFKLVNLGCEDAVLADSLGGESHEVLAVIYDVNIRHRSCRYHQISCTVIEMRTETQLVA